MSGTANYVVGVRINGNASGLSKATQEALRAQRLLAGGSIREYQRMAEARAQLGVRSEREVRREMQQTEAAYNRLARSGTLSWREQRMAAKAMREEVTRLTNEMGRLTTRQKLAMGARVVGALGAATVGAVAVLKPKLDRAMNYDTRLRDVANVGADVGAKKEEREQNYQGAKEAVLAANRYGGGNRDDALDAYNEMVGKGSTFTGDLPRELLPEIMKASTATASAATDMSRIAAAGIQNFGMPKTAAAAKDWFNIAAIGGKLGGFEVRNQAQYLPEQMALAGQIGMNGKADFANLVMLNQAVEKTSGTPDKAAVNVKQLLTDLGSQHFRLRVHKATGEDFTKYAVQNRMRGTGLIDSAMEVVDRAVQKHPAYQQLQKRLAVTTDPEQRAKISSSMKMLEGSVTSQFFHNQESTQAVAAYRANRDLMKTGQKQALSGVDEIGASFDFKTAGPQFQANRLAIEQASAMQTSMEKLTPTVGAVSTQLAELMKQYPGYTTAIMVATGAVGFLATAAGAAAFMGGRMPGGKGGPLIPPKAPGAGAFPKLEGAPAGAGGARGLLGKLGTAGMVAMTAWELFGTSDEDIKTLKDAERKKKGERPEAIDKSAKPGGAPLLAATSAEGRPPASPTAYTQTAPQSYTYTSPDGSAGYRGAGFEDPRLLTRRADAAPQSLAERLAGKTPATAREELKGEIIVRVTGAPGLGVQAETKSSNAGVQLRSDVGTSMRGAGH
jgi:hypothetical protein